MFALDVLERPACEGRMKLVAMVTEPRSIVRFLSALGEARHLGVPHHTFSRCDPASLTYALKPP
ncbi:hypothetical protein [Sorangium sp. So ce381]|uniref:hypothetical protein n=1 Tax=Sorangium sp. So ce381 TaxID=3133307 RepID=UPI003F5B51B1